MDNTDKKQLMSDEELAKISGGAGMQAGDRGCPYCGREYGLNLVGHILKCPMNPSNPYYDNKERV